jgi:proteic killer suppression protein
LIKTFQHKGLKKFFESGTTRGIQPTHARKLQTILTTLHASKEVQDMNAPAFKLHPMTGNEKGVWSVWVNGNWRITFRFEDGDAYIVDYRDYH